MKTTFLRHQNLHKLDHRVTVVVHHSCQIPRTKQKQEPKERSEDEAEGVGEVFEDARGNEQAEYEQQAEEKTISKRNSVR